MTGEHPTPPPPSDRDLEAAEYVLGTLRGVQRQRFEEMLDQDPELRRMVALWQERLSGLADVVPGVVPPPRLWDRIESLTIGTSAIRPAAVRHSLASRLWNNLALWRAVAAAGVVTASLLAAVVMRPLPAPVQEPALVAVLQAPEGPAFAVRIPAAQRANVTPVGERQPPAGNAYELWVVPPRASPVSLGLIERQGVTRVPLERVPPDLVRQGMLLAVSLEPAGGSPTGAPTGPVLYTGTLVEAR